MSTLAKIHIGCKRLGIDDDARRDMQLRIVGKSSLKEMNEAERQKVLSHLVEQGFKPAFKGRSKCGKASRADLRLIHVLWRELGNAGELDRPDRAGLNAFIRMQFGVAWGSVPADVDMLRDHAQISAVIRALKAWGKRAGVELQ